MEFKELDDLNNVLMGDFEVTLDEAGRIAIPRSLRGAFEQKVVLTRGVHPCVRLFSVQEFIKRVKDIGENADTDTAVGHDNVERNIGRAHQIEIDKQGRVLIPPTLRDFAGLGKDCLVVGMLNCIQIWDKERHTAHECNQDTFYERAEALAQKKEQKNAAYSTHSGAAGRDDSVSGSKGGE